MLSLNEKLAYFLRYSTVISIWSTIALEQDHNVKTTLCFFVSGLDSQDSGEKTKIPSPSLSF